MKRFRFGQLGARFDEWLENATWRVRGALASPLIMLGQWPRCRCGRLATMGCKRGREHIACEECTDCFLYCTRFEPLPGSDVATRANGGVR